MNGAARVTYKQASEMNTPIRDIALYSGFRWTTIEMAHPIAKPANKMKSAAVMTSLCESLWFSVPLWKIPNVRHRHSLRFHGGPYPPQPVLVFKNLAK